jgi:ABC-type transporter MlaC component
MGNPSIAAAEDAVEAVTRIYTTTLQTAADPARLADRLAGAIDLRALATRVLGAAYSDATQADRAGFDAVFLDVIALELSEEVHSNQQLIIFGTRSLDNGDIVVLSRITESDSTQRLIDWRMRPCGASYCIYDLRSDNVSFSVARRDDYAARLQAAGGSLAELTRTLQSEVAARQ